MGRAKSSLGWITSDAVVVRFCRACTKTSFCCGLRSKTHSGTLKKAARWWLDPLFSRHCKHRTPGGVSSSSVLGVTVKLRVIHLFAFTAMFDKQRAPVWACHQADQHMINTLSLPQSCLPSSQLSRRHLPRLGKVAKKSNGGIQGRLSLQCCFNISKIVSAPPKTDREELLWIPKLPSIATPQVHLAPPQLVPTQKSVK